MRIRGTDTDEDLNGVVTGCKSEEIMILFARYFTNILHTGIDLVRLCEVRGGTVNAVRQGRQHTSSPNAIVRHYEVHCCKRKSRFCSGSICAFLDRCSLVTATVREGSGDQRWALCAASLNLFIASNVSGDQSTRGTGHRGLPSSLLKWPALLLRKEM